MALSDNIGKEGSSRGMVHRFVMFVDGSNLFGVGRHLEINITDYEGLFGHIFHSCYDRWARSFSGDHVPNAQFLRVYWYVVGSHDEWDFDSPQAISALRQMFQRDPDVRSLWNGRAELLNQSNGEKEADLEEAGWHLFLEDTIRWYEKTVEAVEGLNRFHHSVELNTDSIEIKRCGHWKLDLLNRRRDEKGIDTSFAVDMATMLNSYDVALLISGDADGIPSVQFAKNAGKQVGAVEFLKGYPPEQKAKNVSSKLKTAVDFVTKLYEADLVRGGYAQKRPHEGSGFNRQASAVPDASQ